MPTLKNIQTPGYNGQSCELIRTSSPQRVGALLQDGRSIAVRLECIECDVTTSTCPVCFDLMFEPTIKELSCGHKLHWWCIKKWRTTAGTNHEAAGARCPICRAYVGLAGERTITKHASEIVLQALGAIHQTVARLDGKPEPSFDNELTTILKQMEAAQRDKPDIIERLETLRAQFCAAPSDQNSELLYTALGRVLVVHCFPSGAEQTVSKNYLPAIKTWLASLRA